MRPRTRWWRTSAGTWARLHHDDGNHDKARDDAEAARRIAVRHDLAWHELAALDVITQTDARAAALRRLIPDGLDPDAPATIERRVAAEKATSEDR